jgi:hypothetical protein
VQSIKFKPQYCQKKKKKEKELQPPRQQMTVAHMVEAGEDRKGKGES